MYQYFTIIGNGCHGGYFQTEEAARAVANHRNNLHGREVWTVRAVWLSDPWADDDRPYRTHLRA